MSSPAIMHRIRPGFGRSWLLACPSCSARLSLEADGYAFGGRQRVKANDVVSASATVAAAAVAVPPRDERGASERQPGVSPPLDDVRRSA
ncbi:MAG: hypothetical protein AAF235_11480 [Planctomycetota bacterium]